MRRLFGIATTLAIVSSLFMSTQQAQAVADGTVNCGTSGTFTIVSNIDTTNTNCRGPLTIPDGVPEIAKYAFNVVPDKSSYITSIIFSNSLTTIQQDAFRAASILTSINFGTGIQNISNWNFADSIALTEVTIPSSVISIGTGVFYAASQLESVTFLGNIPSVGTFSFDNLKAGAVVNVVSDTAGFGANGSTWKSLLVSVAVAAPAFTLSSSSETRTVNTAATGFTINSTGGTIASFSISSSAPAGMSFNTTTGAFTGTPTSVASATPYTITATNASGSATAIFTLTVRAAAVVDNSAAEAAAKREDEKRAARAKILAKHKNSENVPLELFAQAEIAGITKENNEAVQSEIAALPEASREDLLLILKIARKYEVVGIIASERVISIHSNSLIGIDLIPGDSKHKEALTAAIKKLPVSERSSYATLKEAIDNEMAEIQTRKDRYVAILARITSRQNG